MSAGAGRPPGRSPRKKAAAVVEMTPEGDASSTVSARANQLKKGNMFLEYVGCTNGALSNLWGKKWDEIAEQEAATTRLFGMVASWLVDGCVIEAGNRNAGQGHDSKTAESIWSGLFNLTKIRFAQSKEEATRVRVLLCIARLARASRAPLPA